ncbi:MAG TPA: preprotein translocase subunit SecG [Candidatus Paceibacterota bacterium]|nr:preprotein translocase subunit SecG [Candidatus Paceibacterota bacterium]
MLTILTWVEIIVSVLLILTIILQQRGADVGGALGGGQEGGVYFSRRGVEKYLFIATIILAIIFVAAAIAIVLLN